MLFKYYIIYYFYVIFAKQENVVMKVKSEKYDIDVVG
jgi:hypothetical protein